MPVAAFIFLTLLMAWPISTRLLTHAPDHQDVYFNLWRLRWFAHALATSPVHLFDGNQFHPERGVLAYSDAMVVQGLLTAPLLWAGLPPVLVHNLALLGAIAASGVGAFVLARHLTGSAAAGIVSGIVFSYAPYRVEHIMHMELQWAMWMPWALWALQRTIDTGAIRFGVATGLFIALQMLSSIYYGIFLALLVPIVALPQLAGLARHRLGRVAAGLALGAALAGAVSAVYAIPYAAASDRVGTRRVEEIRRYSATPRDYLAATEANLLYGAPDRGAPERRLFPGVLPVLLALAGLLLTRPTAWVLAYLVGLAVAFDLSLGLNGLLYPILTEHVGAFRGLRAPARASILVLLCLGVLAARGLTVVAPRVPSSWRRVAGAAAVGLLLLEYAAGFGTTRYDNTAPPLYAWLAQQPPGVVFEFPAPTPDRLPGDEARYAYMSTFHWKPLANGYSGYYPQSYLDRLTAVRNFPHPSAVNALRRDGVRYVVVHEQPAGEARPGVLHALAEEGLWPVGRFFDGRGPATVYHLEPVAPSSGSMAPPRDLSAALRRTSR